MSAQASAATATVHSLLSFRAVREHPSQPQAPDREMSAEPQSRDDLQRNVSRDDTSRDQASDRELAALVSATAKGDAHAFESFYERTIHYANAVARRIVGSNYLEDVLSESYLQAWRDTSRFDAERGNAVSWIVTIARSRALDRLRQENVRHAGMSGAPDVDDTEIEDEGTPGPDTLLENVQAASELHVAIGKLSANERWCIALSYYRDHSHSEIAALTGLPLGTVKSLINRAQQKLRELLTGGKTLVGSKS